MCKQNGPCVSWRHSSPLLRSTSITPSCKWGTLLQFFYHVFLCSLSYCMSSSVLPYWQLVGVDRTKKRKEKKRKEKKRKEKKRKEKKRKEKKREEKRKEKKRKEKKRKEKKRKEKTRLDYAFRRQFYEKPSIIPGCPELTSHKLWLQLSSHFPL